MPVDALRILFIINPISGGGAKSALEQTIRDYFKDRAHLIECYQLNGENDEESIKYWIGNWRPDRVVAAGGDGTLKLVAQVMAGSKIPIGLLPAGSANGMARELGVPDDFVECLDIITGDHTASIDVIRLNGKETCLHLSDFGLNAHLVKNFEKSTQRGMWGYAREIFKVMSHRQQFRVEIKTPGKTVFRHAWMVVIANARMYGTGAMINPQGNIRDGLLEVIVLRKISLLELLKMMLRHRPFNPAKTEVIQATEAVIAMKRSVHFQVDGEYLGQMRKIKAVVQPNAIKMLLPAPEPTSDKPL
jgi:diacylglycerol kinase (ATP)